MNFHKNTKFKKFLPVSNILYWCAFLSNVGVNDTSIRIQGSYKETENLGIACKKEEMLRAQEFGQLSTTPSVLRHRDNKPASYCVKTSQLSITQGRMFQSESSSSVSRPPLAVSLLLYTSLRLFVSESEI